MRERGQSLMVTDKVIQAKHGLDFIGNQYKNSVMQDSDDRRGFSSPSPAKLARIEGCITPSSKNSKKAEKRGRYDCFELISCRKDKDVDITPDGLAKGDGKELPTFCQKHILSTSNNSVTSTRTCLPRSSSVVSAKSPVAFLSPTAEYWEADISSFKSEHTSLHTVGECGQDQPDSSTTSFHYSTREHEQSGRKAPGAAAELRKSAGLSTTSSVSKGEAVFCQVCEDVAAGFYCGAYICEACKKFFIRASKLNQPRYVCLRSSTCLITRENRVQCQCCRYQKCLQLNMYYPKDGHKCGSKMSVQEIPCRVCSAPSSGFHFGALTCEGCKGFFRRMAKERDSFSYKCSRHGDCKINALTRNMCKACRYNKCLQIGMSIEGSRIGRQPNAVKHAISLEARKQTALKIEPGTDIKITDSSPSTLNVDSVTLDPCLSVQQDDGLQSVSETQISTSVGAHQTACREMDVVKPESISSPQGNPMLTRAEHQDLEVSMTHSDIIRQNMPSPEYDKYTHNVFSSSCSILPLSINIPSDIKPQMFERPRNETFDLLSLDQAEDLSIDVSSTRTSNTSTEHMYPNSTMSTSNTVQLSSSSVCPPSTTPPCFVSLPSSPHQPLSPHYYPVDYTSRSQQNSTCASFINSFVDRNKNLRLGYQHSEHHEDNTSVYHVDLHNNYHTDTQTEGRMSQQETFINMLCTQTAQSQKFGSSFSLQFHDGNRSPNVIPKEHSLRSQPLHQSQILLSRHNTRDIHTAEYQTYASQIGKCDKNRDHEHVNSFSDRICSSLPPYHLNLSQQMPACQPKKLSPLYAPLHYIPHYPALPVAPYSYDETRHVPTSPLNTNIPEPCTTSADAVTTSRNLKDMPVPTEELHAILLNAARNLAHFCAVNRAKSDVYDPDRFKDVDSTWEKMMEHFNFHAKCIVRFAKRVPGFRSLKIDDQVLLLRMATYSLVILNHSRAYEPETGFYNYFNFTEREIRMIRDLFPEFDILHTHYKHIGNMAQRQGLTEVEYAYMSCMLLLNNEYPGLENTEMTKELKERYMNAFLDYEIEHFPKGRHRFAEMLLHLSKFSHLSMQHNVAVGLVITKNPQLHIPQLYAEMYINNGSSMDSSDSTTDDETPDIFEFHEPPVGIVK